MDWLDHKYIGLVSSRLDKFKRKGPNLYNFRCPICGDSSKNKTKARGFVYAKKGNYFFMCHNCGASMSFYNFLDKVDPDLLKEYSLERYKNGETGTHNYPKPSFDEYKTKPSFKNKTKEKIYTYKRTSPSLYTRTN